MSNRLGTVGLAAGLSVGLAMASPAHAQSFIGSFDDWSAFHDGAGAGKACYIASVPLKETGDYTRRGDTYVLVTHRPGEKIRDVFELRAGYTFKKNSEVTVDVDGRQFKLFTDGGTAWARDDRADQALAQAMIKGRRMVVSGVSSRGTETVDTYSLRGFTAAYRSIGRECNTR